VLTVTGNVLKEHRLLPSQDLKEAMSDFVDAMDLSNYEVDENEYVALRVGFRFPANLSPGTRSSSRQ
jgi:hypothetical protein